MLKIATWNVNSLRIRLPHVLDWWERTQPDVLCLQEIKMENSLFPHAAFQEMGLYTACHGQKSYNGVALISRFPLEEISTGMELEKTSERNVVSEAPPMPAKAGIHEWTDVGGHASGNGTATGQMFLTVEQLAQSRLLAATVKGTRIISAYVPNGEALSSPKFTFKQNFYTHLQSYVEKELSAHPNLVLAGDFNIAADARDVVNPTRAAKEVLFTPQEREWLENLQKSTGLADAFRLVNQDEHVFSWWDYRTFTRNPANGMRIDYLFVSRALHSKVQAVHHYGEERTKPQPSDHIPVMLTLNT